MHRPHFRINRGHRPTTADGLRDFDEAAPLSVQEDGFATGRSAMPSVEELRRLMHNQPEVRQQLLNEIRRKLARGDFLTRDAAQQSAGRLLDSGELFPPTP